MIPHPDKKDLKLSINIYLFWVHNQYTSPIFPDLKPFININFDKNQENENEYEDNNNAKVANVAINQVVRSNDGRKST